MADPSFNLKTGADSQLYYSREVTSGDDKDKLMSKDGAYKYPCLSRQTGNSIRGTTESIESNELRKGRTRSAPRKGNSSAEGSLDFESSPITFDDFMEAALRGEWTLWKGDKTSTNKALVDAINVSNLGFEDGDYCMATRCANKIDTSKAVGFGRKKMFRFFGENESNGYDEKTKSWEVGTDATKGLFEIPKGSIIHELNCGTKDIKYMLLRQFGGVEGEDIYQKFDHMAVSTISNDISVGSIITGSVGFMGANDPKMLRTDKIPAEFDTKNFAGIPGEDTAGFVDGVTTGKTLIKNLPNSATQTDQFTAREGFLYLNGKNIEFANAMDWNLDNGLQKNFAIFVRNSISTTPLSLDITGNITTYLITGHSDDVYNTAVDDEDNEILWCVEDNEDNPKYLYIFQIFKAKFTDHDASVGGADTLNVSFPFQSFGEQAIRIFRVTLPEATVTASETKVEVTFGVEVPSTENGKFAVEVSKNEVPVSVGSLTIVGNVLSGEISATAGDELTVVVTYQMDTADDKSKGEILNTKVIVK